MATDKPRFSITLDYDTMDSVMEYKEKNKLSTQSKAIQRLVEIGLSEILAEESAPSPTYPSDPLSPMEHCLVADFRDASDEIREEAAAMLHRSAERNRKDAISNNANAG